MKLSVVIPSYQDAVLNNTVQDLLDKSVGDIEILVNIDGERPDDLIEDSRVSYTFSSPPVGMRSGINLGLKRAVGDYIMKTDAHCLFAEGFDEVLMKDMEEDWLVIPRRYSLHLENWDRDLRFPPKDYHYLSYPTKSFYGYSIYPQVWGEMTKERMVGYDIDDTMTFQGSCWFADRKYFMEHVGYMDYENYTQFAGEPLEVGLNYWLGGGKVKVNKNTWYAHLFKNKNYYKGKKELREYKLDIKTRGGHEYGAKHWMENQEPGMVYSFSWLIEKFWPVPTWPEDRSLWKYPK